MSEKKLFIKNVVGFSLGTWISFAISLIVIPISTRLFMPEQLGKINMFNISVNLILAIALLGLDQAMVRFYYEPPSKTSKKYLLTIVTLTSSLFLIFVVGSVSLLLWRRISFSIAQNYNLAIVICLLFASLAALILRYLNLIYRMEQQVVRYTIQAVLIALTTRALFLLVAFWDANYFSAIIMITATNFVLSLTFLFIQRSNFEGRLNKPSKQFIRAIGTFALPLIPLTVIVWLNNSVSALIISRMLDFEALGIFTVAASLAGTIGIIQAGFNAYWAPYVYKNYKENSHRFWLVHKMVACGLTMFSLLILLLQDLAFLLLGAEFRGAVQFFAFLMLAPICYTLGETTGLGINIEKKTFWSPIILLSTITINVVLCFVLIPYFGLPGVAMASGISGIIFLILRTIIGERYFKSIQSYKYVILAIGLLLLSASFNFVFVETNYLKHIVNLFFLVSGVFVFRKEIKVLVKSFYELFCGMFLKKSA